MKDKGMLKTFRLGAELNIHKIPTALSISIKKKKGENMSKTGWMKQLDPRAE